jgi:hypothetical protein
MSNIIIVDEHNQDVMCRKAGCYVYQGARLWIDDEETLHHLDGPALVSPDGAERWYIHGKEVTRDVTTFFHENNWPVARGLDTPDKRSRFIVRFMC